MEGGIIMQQTHAAPAFDGAPEPKTRRYPTPDTRAEGLDLDDLEFFRPLPVSLN